jgi:hypothetical protein
MLMAMLFVIWNATPIRGVKTAPPMIDCRYLGTILQDSGRNSLWINGLGM